MRFWLIAIWRTIPRSWVIVSLPVLLPLAALGAWWLVGGLFVTPPSRSETQTLMRLEQLLRLAAEGDRRAAYEAGAIFREGTAGLRDVPAARHLFERAADRGSTDALHALGELYARGLGVRQNYARAAELFRAAAGLGRNAEAQYALGQLYFYGRGVPHDYAAAIEWYRRAALAGHAGAQAVMGTIHEHGFGTEMDPVEAYVWYALAAEQRAKALTYRTDIDPAAARDQVGERLTRLQTRAAAQRLAETRARIGGTTGQG